MASGMAEALVWLPEEERVPRDWPCAVQSGAMQLPPQCRAVIIAPHPCDATAAWKAYRAAQRAGVPTLTIRRPVWTPTRGDTWVPVRNEAQAAEVIEPGARVLTTLGRAGLPNLKALNAHVIARRLRRGEGAFPLKYGRFVDARGPFRVAQEMRFLRKERIDWLLLRNAGGPGGYPKLEAARRLRLRVAMVTRPAWPGGPCVETVAEALEWLNQE